jgi:glutamate dehydrogenase
MSSTSHLFAPQILTAVASMLSTDDLATLSRIQLPEAKGPAEQIGVYLDLLFSRAPNELMRKKNPEDLRNIVSGSLKTIAQVASSPNRVAHRLERSGEWTGLFLALDDHPFIISSLAERLYEEDITLECFQHPILSVEKKSIALSYLEVAPRSNEAVEQAIPILVETLHSLKQVIADHELMLSTAHKVGINGPANLNTEWGEIPAGEVASFLEWITSGTFFFVGASVWDNASQLNQGYGIWNTTSAYRDVLQSEVLKDFQSASSAGFNFSIHKLQLNSIIHRRVPLLHIAVRPDPKANEWISIVGYLTSKALSREAEDIPLLRFKLRQVLAGEKTPPNTHDYKYVIEVIDNMPTDEALRMPIVDLRNIAYVALGLFSREDARSITCVDAQKRWALTALVMPPDRYSAEVKSRVQASIESYLAAPPFSSEVHLDSSKKRQLRMYVSTPLPGEKNSLPNLETLGRILQRHTLQWDDALQEHLRSTNQELPSVTVSFPEGYQASVSIAEAAADYTLAANVSPANPLAVSAFFNGGGEKPPTLSFVSLGKSISLSAAVPVLENVGLEVLDANSYPISCNSDDVFILKCVVRPFDNEALSPEVCSNALAPALVKILRGTAMDDPLNLLLRKIPITIDQVSLLRAYCGFLWQTYKIATKRTMWKALAYAPEVALHMIEIFDTAFNPDLNLSTAERTKQCARIEQQLSVALRKVLDITYDRILRAILALLKNTVRTNFFKNPETIALKVRSQQVEFMPHPRPLYEIFVFSPRIEGTHLRSAKVARGGIRWSERLDDYRSEVLGLMKTQRVKNVIIVPSGAKGGFIIKQTPSNPDATPAAVTAGYKEYVTALLSISDNTVNGTVVHPAQVVVHDEPDPYIVVAADKGTAAFSDIANTIAQNDFSFWLGDAFASGGSAGYDHKKYGITARGGWECVERHAKDIGVDTNAPFTAIGIGDMSGDVFGNAMIITPCLMLLGAFNHKHIFIDPTPNHQAAFEERMRLFNLPRSQWSDFNPAIISKGGGVFNRYDKEIQLTPEIRQALGVPDSVPAAVDGETLISLILKASVTLMWNGGIGTYVKARSESNSEVNDGGNDSVRINADELRCRIVGEGGNLGFTQKARIEAAQQGIQINTDAIDNSGGVDLSDHEVNLKLLLSPMVANHSITLEARNALLKDISGDVVELVLQHNRDQSLMITMSALHSPANLEQYRALIREMHTLGFLDRNRDFLPDEQELDLRIATRRGILRPELALCSAAVKMWLKDGLRNSKLLDDASLDRFLMSYFPARIQSEYRSSVLSHPLRQDIISNEIVGEMTLAVGIPFIPTMVASQSASIPSAMKSLLAADAIIGSSALRKRIRSLDSASHFDTFSAIWDDISSALRKAGSWLLQWHTTNQSLQELISLYADSFSRLRSHARVVFTGDELTRFEKRVNEYRSLGVSEDDAVMLSLYRRVYVALEVLWCAREYSQDVTEVARVLSFVLEHLGLPPIFAFENTLQSTNKWEQELAAGAFQEIRRSLSCIVGTVLSRSNASEQSLAAQLSSQKHSSVILSIMKEVQDNMRSNRPFTISVLPLLARHIRELSHVMVET